MRVNDVKNNLTINTTYSYPKPFSNKELSDFKKKLSNLDRLDISRVKTMERRNFLETYLYEKKDWFSSEEAKQYATDNERKDLVKMLDEIKVWFDAEGHAANLTTIEDKIRIITGSNAKINTRVERQRRYIRSTANFNREFNKTSSAAEAIRVTKTWTEEFYTKNFSQTMNEIQNWYAGMKEKQEKLSLTQEPVLTSEMLDSKVATMKKELTTLDRIQKPVLDNNKMNIEDMMLNKMSIEELMKMYNSTLNQTNSTATLNDTEIAHNEPAEKQKDEI